MLNQILIGAALLGATAVVQAVFMLAGLRALEKLRTSERDFEHHHATLIIVSFVLFMFLAVVIDVWLWAAVYYFLGAITTIEEALYFSTASFTTIGYGDVVLGREWRLLSSFEGANGMIIFGWITALVIAAVQRFYSWTSD